MEINQLRVHERVINFLYRNFEQGVFRVDEEGTNMWMKNILIYMIH